MNEARADQPPLLTAAPITPRPGSPIANYLAWLDAERGLSFDAWPALWRWSVEDVEGFWQSIWDFSRVISHSPHEAVLSRRTMPGAQWFPGATLNLAEHALRHGADDDAAVIAYSQTRDIVELSFAQLRNLVRDARAGLRALGVGRGDRVAAFLPNIPETIVAYLATISLGATWASCSPEFGSKAVIDRFSQIEPTVLLAIDSYVHGTKRIDRRRQVDEIRHGLPTVRHVIGVPYLGAGLPSTVTTTWPALLDRGKNSGEPLAFEPVPFDHPLSVLFTSGTTGVPKPIVHGHGGVLLEHLKNHALHWDLGAGDRLMWFTTTAWMMWNALASALLVGSSIVLIDGDPGYPDLDMQWRLAEQFRPTVMGVSAGFLQQCMREERQPTTHFDLSSIRQLGVVGSPLPVEGYRWVHAQFGDDVLLNVGSGGTDVCTGIVQGSPWQPVWEGEISGASLGVDACAFDAQGQRVIDRLGELVIRQPMPSMPVGFWGDPDGRRYHAAYFDTYPGIWRHGDWIRFTESGSCRISGRSDGTLNRGGVRLGTAEFYSVVESFPEVDDSLVVHLEDPEGGPGSLLLFVVLGNGLQLGSDLTVRLRAAIRDRLSPRHVPDEIVAVDGLPHTRTGKKMEVPVKRILMGRPLSDAGDLGVVDDARLLTQFCNMTAAASSRI